MIFLPLPMTSMPFRLLSSIVLIYLLKPIKSEELSEALEKFSGIADHYKQHDSGGLNMSQIEQLLKIQHTKYKTRFIAKVGDQIKHIDVSDVAYFRAEDNEVMLVTSANQRYIVDYSLEQLARLVSPEAFFRANRGLSCYH